jgi:hypothetical protein
MKYLNSKKLNYLVYIVSVTILILAVFDTFITIRIHKQLARVASKQGRWPVGAYIYDRSIGFDFAPNISGPINNDRFYVKSHQLGYRIGESEDPVSYQPGGLLSLGCSFTYGDQVESGETFTQLAADSLNIPAYNYGICSFSYIHALLKAQKLKDQGVLDKLKPKYVVLGCWSGLPDRSRSPFPPLASKSIPLPAAYLAKDGNDLKIHYPMKTESVFNMVELYRKEGTGLSFKKFIRIFFAVPRYIYLYVKNNSLAKKLKSGSFKNDVSDYEVYDFYFSGIESVFSGYGTRIIVLFMPNANNEPPDKALKKAIADHPGILLADGLQAIQKYGCSSRDYVGIHPKPAAHKAYAEEIINVIRPQGAVH